MKFFVIVFFISGMLSAQKTILQDTITYREYSKLKWEDFKAKAPENSEYSASVCTGMSYKWSYSTSNGKIEFDYNVKSNLYRNLSWSKYTEGKENVLAHEQIHYDITELYVRKFRAALKDYKENGNLRNIRKNVTTIYEALEEERKALQLQYDDETNHSLIKEAQLHWHEKIVLLLEEYKEFK